MGFHFWKIRGSEAKYQLTVFDSSVIIIIDGTKKDRVTEVEKKVDSWSVTFTHPVISESTDPITEIRKLFKKKSKKNCIESIFYFGTNNGQLTLWLYFNSLDSVVGSLIAHNISNKKKKSIARSLEEIKPLFRSNSILRLVIPMFFSFWVLHFIFQYYRVPSL